MHRMRLALSQVKAPVMLAGRQRNPQHFHRVCTGSALLRTSDPHVCAQTAGKVHRQQGSSPVACLPAWQAVAHRRAGACVPGQPAGWRGSGPGLDEIAPGRQPPDDRLRPEDRPPAHPPPARRSRASRSVAECASSIRSSCPGCAAGHARLRCRNHKPKHDTLVPSPPSPSRTIRPAGPSRASNIAERPGGSCPEILDHSAFARLE